MKTLLHAALACPLAALSLAACTADVSDPGATPAERSATTLSAIVDVAHAGAIFTIDNAAAGNHVLAYSRAADGTLSAAGTYATGGLGTDAGLGTQGALASVLGGKFLVVVNAGSDDVSSFAIHGTKLELVSRVSSGGTMPVSVAAYDHLVYAVNGGTPNGVSGLRISETGELSAIADSTAPLSADSVGPGQIGFSPGGGVLTVTEKSTNQIDVWVMSFHGKPLTSSFQPSAGTTPFGFAFTPRGALLVSDAAGAVTGAGEVSSYTVAEDGALTTVSAGVADGHTAPCWIATTSDGHGAYATNAHDGTVSGYAVDPAGALTLGSTVTLATGSVPLDLGLDASSSHVFVIDGGNHAIVTLDRASDGKLTIASSVGGLPAAAGGVVVL